MPSCMYTKLDKTGLESCPTTRNINECLREMIYRCCCHALCALQGSSRVFERDRRLHIHVRHIKCGHFKCHLVCFTMSNFPSSSSFHYPTTRQDEPLRAQCHPSRCSAHRCWCSAGSQEPWPVHQRALQTSRIGCASWHSH